MKKALRASLALVMAMTLVGCGSVGSEPAGASSAPAITTLDTHEFYMEEYGLVKVRTYCRNGDFFVASFSYREGGVQIEPELKDRCVGK